MSATPLPSLPIVSSTQHARAPRLETSQHGGASFNSHLQSAQQQQSPPADSTQTATQTSDAAQNDNNQQTATANKPDKPGDADASKQDDASNAGDVGIDLTGGVGTLAHVVLNLIDHAVGDAHGGVSANTHAAPAKPAAQAGSKPTTAQPDALAAALIPTPLAVAMTVPAGTAAGNVGAQKQGIDALAQKASIFASTNTDATTASDASHAPVATDGSASTAGSGDTTQTFAASLAAIGHAAVPAATSTDSASQGSPDLAALGSLTAAVSAPPAGATASTTHNLAMNAPVGSSDFAKELGQHITWLSGQDVKQAQIRLNPQDLGPLDVKVSVEHGRVDVSFLTQHPAATAAVQQGLDQLNQMLGGQGLSLGHATVGQHAQQQFAQQGQQGQQSQASSSASDESVADTPIAAATRIAVGLVDAFA